MLINGTPGAMWAPGGAPRVFFVMGFRGERILRIDLVADPERLRSLDLQRYRG